VRKAVDALMAHLAKERAGKKSLFEEEDMFSLARRCRRPRVAAAAHARATRPGGGARQGACAREREGAPDVRRRLSRRPAPARAGE